MRGVLCLAMAMLVIALSGRASADENDDARKRFVSGSRHYDLREYPAVLEDFKESFRLSGDPSLLFNIAQCHRLLEHYEDALASYKRFLARSPETPVRPEVERRMAEIQKILEEHKQEPPKPAPPVPAPVVVDPPPPSPQPPAIVDPTPAPVVAKKPLYRRWWLWTAVSGVAAVGLGVGLGVGLSQSSSGSSVPRYPGVTF
jgi:tetratricopeptide (TPR) repeat protein